MQAGMFLWMALGAGVTDADEILDLCAKARVVFVPGEGSNNRTIPLRTCLPAAILTLQPESLAKDHRFSSDCTGLVSGVFSKRPMPACDCCAGRICHALGPRPPAACPFVRISFASATDTDLTAAMERLAIVLRNFAKTRRPAANGIAPSPAAVDAAAAAGEPQPPGLAAA